MKKYCLALVLALVWFRSNPGAAAQTASNSVAPAAPAPALTAEDKARAGYEKHTRQILDALKLDDPAKAAKVHDLMTAQFAAWKEWHQQNDARLGELWSQYAKIRNEKNQTNTDLAMGKIDAVYAGFKPRHDAFKAKLAALLTPEQIETVEDVITINKVKVTMNAYGQIFPGLTGAQKAFLLMKLKAAREEGIDAGSMKEVSAFFKKYKDQIEAYLTAQGYDVKQAYKDFVAKQKAGTEAKTTATKSGSAATAEDKEKE